MPASRRGLGSVSAALVVLGLVTGCAFAGTSSPTSPSCSADEAPAPTTTAGATGSEGGDLVIVGRIVTMDEPADGGGAPHRGRPRDLRRHAGRGAGRWPARRCRSSTSAPTWPTPDSSMPTPTGSATASYYGLDSAEEAMDAALTPRLDLDLRAVGQPGAPRRAGGPRRRRRPAASRRRLPRPELRRRVLRRLVHRSRARAGGRPPARPGAEDPSRRRTGRGHQLGAGRPDRDHRPGGRGGLAGLGPHA